MVTDSVMFPTSSVTSILTRWLTPSSIPESAAVLNPAISPVTRYVPVGSEGAVYSPAPSLVTVRVSPVPVLVIVTFAPATTAPVESTTVPTMVPVTACAAAAAGRHETSPMQTRKTAATRPNDVPARSLIDASGD